ncbi:putative transcriptional acitvator, Baf family [Crinalium epipsammum PCC 9333]|uniref:Type III pantothenate kinase n=2 Tax=Crinalium TaxID=241421 RepID=K9VXM8_9CYAN|nr:pantothenate kinase [Crinalium epipsammum]AFZ12868.1 putative transcriptional acitvator, Baf family [Crinalium epipsammum PCC 9333]
MIIVNCDNCLGLMIGNSRLHWALFTGATLEAAWDTDHLPALVVEQLIQSWQAGEWKTELFPDTQINAIQIPNSTPIPLYVASVVPVQTQLWQTYPYINVITLDQLPLHGLYPTLGIDRALAVLGAGENLGFPVLVIDGGTALTFTGVDAQKRLVGGAILPGLRLQIQSLTDRTAALPKIELYSEMPPRWALNTVEAIQSGVSYTVLAGVKDFIESWWQEFPESKIAITGGDRTLLLVYLQAKFPNIAAKVIADPHLIFWGMQSLTINN